MTSRWNYLPLSAEKQKLESELARRYAKVSPISELLVQRGIQSIDEAEKFFHPSLRDLHDPFLMPDMDKAVDRLNRAMGAKERILVYGDYDVDGTTAVACLCRAVGRCARVCPLNGVRVYMGACRRGVRLAPGPPCRRYVYVSLPRHVCGHINRSRVVASRVLCRSVVMVLIISVFVCCSGGRTEEIVPHQVLLRLF